MSKRICELESDPRRDLQAGDIVRHFKNKLYLIVDVAQHTETGEKLMIYRALYNDFALYARPYEMFVSEVDREKYPDVPQVYRMEKISYWELCNLYKEDLSPVINYITENKVKVNLN